MDLTSDQLRNLGSMSLEDRELKTMMFTDMVGSTQLKEELGDVEALKLIHQHHQLARELLATFHGAKEISTSGDSFFLIFNAPSDAVRFALQFQVRLRKLGRAIHHSLHDRFGIHAGEVVRYQEADSDRVADINGIQVDTCARVMSLAGPDHILLTRFAFDNARQMIKSAPVEGVGSIEWMIHGFYELKGIKEPVEICEVTESGTTDLQSPTDSDKARRIGDEVDLVDTLLVENAAQVSFLRRLLAGTKLDRKQGLIGAALTSSLGFLLLCSTLLDNLSLDLSYLFCHFTTPLAYTQEVELVVMDEDSKKYLNQSDLKMWDRRLHGRLVDWLNHAHARALVFDILFDGERSLEDPELLAAINRYGKVAVAVKLVHDQKTIGDNVVSVTTTNWPFGWSREKLKTNIWYGLTEAASLANLTIRQPRFSCPAVSNQIPSLAEELVNKLRVKPSRSPLNAWLNYYCPPEKIPYHSYYQVLSNFVDPSMFSNKVVFVGSRILARNPDQAGTDLFRTPYSFWGFDPAPGVVVHATSYLNLKRGDWLQRPSRWFEILGIMIFGISCGYLLTLLPPTRAAGVGVILSLGIAVVSVIHLWMTGTWFPWLIPCLVQIPIATIWSALANSYRISLEKQKMQTLLAVRRSKPASSTLGSPATSAMDKKGITITVKTTFEVPDYQLIRLVGKGAYGQVWLAKDVLGNFHAVKIVQRSSFTEERPYEREFHGLQRFTPLSRQHPGLVHILHVGRNDANGFMYYIMEVADDEQLGQKIESETYTPRNLERDLSKRGSYPVSETVNLAIALADALGFLHTNGLIHRDIKPSNIIFVNDHPKLADIGLVTEMAVEGKKVTLVGTEDYTAPEGPGSAAADVYSLGKLLYVASTGYCVTQFPDLPSDLSRRAETGSFSELNRIILKACEPAVQQRYSTTQSLLADLHQLHTRLLPTTTNQHGGAK